MTAVTNTSPRAAATAPDAGPTSNPIQLALATGVFASCFAVYGSVAGMMPELTDRLKLSEGKVGVALAVPALLGSLGRIPFGILTDRIGGRVLFIAILAFSIIPAVLLAEVTQYWQLLVCGFLLGVPLGVFAVGVPYVSGWYAPDRQGTALGIFGLGLAGQSLALFGSPRLAKAISFAWGVWTFAAIAGVFLVLAILFAKDAPRRGPQKKFSDFTKPLKEKNSWLLSLYYFLTFGGFLAMGAYLPKFLTIMFHMSKPDAGLRAAGFALLATAMRPAGGWLADRIGGLNILLVVFPVTAIFALFMASPTLVMFRCGALGIAVVIGLGNGAVFKLVPQYFPKAVGSVTGLVGAIGGLGGFFPPLVLGALKQATGKFTAGFFLLSIFSIICMIVCLLNRSNEKKTA